MANPTRAEREACWRALHRHRAGLTGLNVEAQFALDPQRRERMTGETGELFADLSRHRCTDETLALLGRLATAANVAGFRDRMFAGEVVNESEQRPALHTALRAAPDDDFEPAIVTPVRRERSRAYAFADTVRGGTATGAAGKPFTHVVTLGMGGSVLGPALLVDALQDGVEAPHGRAHFVDNLDPVALDAVLAECDPAETLFLVVSKTFSTLETMTNARRARDWLVARMGADYAWQSQFAGITAHHARAVEWGLPEERIFVFWDWVGGRFSLWSAVGLPAVIALGTAAFDELLAGARELDEHFRTTPLERNLPVQLGLLGCWYRECWNAPAHAVVPYSERLRLLPDYLQQLEMESNGKCVQDDGAPMGRATTPVLFGGRGTTSQHAFFQLLHQGIDIVPVDFIAIVDPGDVDDGARAAHRDLLANCLAQGQALMRGRPRATVTARLLGEGVDPASAERQSAYREFTGNRPSTTLLMSRLTPRSLGALLALYEHKVVVQAVLWGINPFDQFGVELGKELAANISTGSPTNLDSATEDLLARCGLDR